MTDDEFLRSLRARADAAVPPVAVDIAAVIPRARRRRAIRRTAALTAVAVVVAGAGWLATAAPWTDDTPIPPAVTHTPTPIGPPGPTEAPTQAPEPSPTETGHFSPEDFQSLFWYQEDDSGLGMWIDRHGSPFGYYDTNVPAAFDGWTATEVLLNGEIVWVNWANVDVLPHDPAALIAAVQGGIRGSVFSDPGSLTDEAVTEQTPGAIISLLQYAAVSSPEATRALADALASLPNVRSEGTKTDSLGRSGRAYVVNSTVEGTDRVIVETYLIDLTGGGILESRWTNRSVTTNAVLDSHTMTYIENRPSDPPPFSPAEAGLTCGTWAECAAGYE